MSDININITTDEESKINMNVMETVPVGKYEEKINKVLGGNMPITLAYKENTGLANDENYPSLKYLAECFEYFRGEIGGSGGSVDLSNYYTKTEVDDKDNELQRGVDFVLGQIANFQFDLNLKENLSNKTDTISDQPSMDKYPSEVAVFDHGQSLINSCNSFTASHVAQEIGNIETSLENIIEKYGLGGDAS